MRDYVTCEDIGCKVKTEFGIGILVHVDAGAGFYVEPLNKNEEWAEVQFDGRELEKLINRSRCRNSL